MIAGALAAAAAAVSEFSGRFTAHGSGSAPFLA